MMPLRAPMLNVSRTRGFTMIELMVSVTIALFLVGGALAIVARTKNTFVAQNELAQLQDNERLTMTFMAEVIESAGYFPNPKVNLASTVMPAGGVFASAGQAVFGSTDGAGSDTLTVRFGAGYAAGVSDNVYGCNGSLNTSVTPYDTYTNYFFIKVIAGQPSQLRCTLTNNAGVATTVTLVNGVTKLAISYAVKNGVTDTGSCADSYLTQTQIAASGNSTALWASVCAVKVTATFTNPLNPAGTPITLQRVIAVMTDTGVNS